MKKIVFVCYGLGVGGIEKCLISLANALDKTKYDVYVAPMNPEYDLMTQLSDNVSIYKFDDYFINTTDYIGVIKNEKNIVSKLIKLIKYIIFRLSVKLGNNQWKYFKALPEEFDVAVAYAQTGYVPYYTIDKIKADKKILWYHDLRYERTQEQRKIDEKYYPQYDFIVGVSNPCADVLKKHFPNCESNIIIKRNIINDVKILEMADSFTSELDKKVHNIVTVARISKEKGYDLAIQTALSLKKKDLNFVWNWIGDGPNRNEFKELIQSNNLSDNFVLFGNKENPYPYIKDAEVYVQPSYTEAYCTTIIEAKILKKPIVATNVKSISEQLVDEKDGLIADFSGESISNCIQKLFEDEKLRTTLVSNLSKEDLTFQSYLKEYDELFLS